MLLAAYAADADRLRRFETEARAVSALNHPNILTIYDIGTAEGAPYLVTELLEGQTLRQRMSERGAAGLADRGLRAADCQRSRGGARKTHRSPRSEARECLRHEGRADQDPRFRSRQARAARIGGQRGDASASGDRPDADRHGHRDGRLHVSGAGARCGGGSPLGYLRLRCDPLRDDRRSPGVPRRVISGNDERDSQGGAGGFVGTFAASKGSGAVNLSMERIIRHCLEKSPEARFQAARDLVFALQEVLSSATPAVRSAPETVAALGGRRPWGASGKARQALDDRCRVGARCRVVGRRWNWRVGQTPRASHPR